MNPDLCCCVFYHMLDHRFDDDVDDEVRAKNGMIKKIVDVGGVAALGRLAYDPATSKNPRRRARA